MPVRGLQHEEFLGGLHAEAMTWLGEGVDWFDAHTHIGHNDPDGYEADPAELLEALDVAGQRRALVFAMHEPGGYRDANDVVLRACADSAGRLLPLARIDPKAPDALDEARRCLEAGALGFKLHPRSDDFGLPHAVAEQVVALAGEHRRPVLFHAGRGIPNLGDAAVAMAREHPGARIILAHAGISDLGLVGPLAADVSNLLFDTSWWQVADMMTLMTTVPPGQVLYASDMPYGAPRWSSWAFVRYARAAGLSREQIRAMAGEQLHRVVHGEDLLDLGPAPGPHGLGPRVLGFERATAYLTAAIQMTFRGGDPTEALSLARLATQTHAEAPFTEELEQVDGLIALAQERFGASGDPYTCVHPALAAHVIAGTASVDGLGGV
ncbi:MAG: amidohydrolase family protein [Solirubrobacterales bacterium]|nr:amidohydrolase family protein [Solirubrobacterales bacterium]